MCVDVKKRGCEDEKMICVGARKIGCEDFKMRCVGVKKMRCENVEQTTLLEEPFAQTLSKKKFQGNTIVPESVAMGSRL